MIQPLEDIILEPLWYVCRYQISIGKRLQLVLYIGVIIIVMLDAGAVLVTKTRRYHCAGPLHRHHSCCPGHCILDFLIQC